MSPDELTEYLRNVGHSLLQDEIQRMILAQETRLDRARDQETMEQVRQCRAILRRYHDRRYGRN